MLYTMFCMYITVVVVLLFMWTILVLKGLVIPRHLYNSAEMIFLWPLYYVIHILNR